MAIRPWMMPFMLWMITITPWRNAHQAMDDPLSAMDDGDYSTA
jgi:hypothetical protein